MAAWMLARVFSAWWAKLPGWWSAVAVLPIGKRPVRAAALQPLLPSAIICAAVFAIVFVLWRTGQFQFFELQVYDRFLKSQVRDATADSMIVIVGVTELDLQQLDAHPVPDGVLANALQMLLECEPATIVVDFYRNLPVPGTDPSDRERLAGIFIKNPHVVAIQRLGLGREKPIPPPSFLAKHPFQIGFNDFPILDEDVDDTVRRVALMMWEDGKVYYSDPLLATLLYLQTHDIPFSLKAPDPKDLPLGEATLRPFSANDGAYVQADARGYQVLLDFRGPAQFPTYSLHELLEGKVPPEDIRGRVAFIGPLASSLKDYLSTPLNKRFPGLMLHAHVVDQLLRHATSGERPLRFWREWQEAAWLLAWCVVGTIAGASVRSPLIFVTVVTVGVAVLAGVYCVAMLNNLWLLVVAPGVGFTGTAALGTSHQAYLEKKQRAVLMKLFSQHVSADIAADIWQHREQFMEGHRPKPQILTGTVFFSDLKGFTRLAETLPPDVLLDWLNEYMEVMATLIERHGGMVNKYMGDAIMAVFGAPIPRTTEDEIRRDAAGAVSCAVEMGLQLDQLNEDWKRRGLPTTSMRIGIATGPLVSGSIGGSRRLEYTVTGDTVVIAKRLESAHKDSTQLEKVSLSCRVLITEKTAAMLGPQFKVREVGPMLLDGKHVSTGVHVVIGKEPESRC